MAKWLEFLFGGKYGVTALVGLISLLFALCIIFVTLWQLIILHQHVDYVAWFGAAGLYVGSVAAGLGGHAWLQSKAQDNVPNS